MDDVRLRLYQPDDAEWLVEAHQTHYRAAEGFDDTFGPLVARILAVFAESHDATRERGWIAEDGQGRLGSIFCVDAREDGLAKLRLFLLAERGRGTGLAPRMLGECMRFARGAGYAGMTLWTHRSHVAAGRLYERTGFALIAEKPVRSFGVDLVEQHWRIAF